ncbi:Formylglycine-generating enzyme [Candidatus Magnetaquicoccaceae bacterium FCR-1]|uniref:Formylglycine-generating enzyme n=1 Tax=Candidatus Magnetaquiglobus chichijimensis TaxID=3141448 RepID=A0ABQ0CCN8_9PROT
MNQTAMIVVAALGLVPGVAMAETPEVITNSIGMEMIRVPAGTFLMGSDKHFDTEAGDSEQPRHKVTISRPFCLGKYEVTQEQWTAVMKENPSEFKGRTLPVQEVSWNMTQQFIKKINELEKSSDYRLPTEAEWEYAARAGTNTIRHWGDGEREMLQYAWHGDAEGKTGGKPHPVGQLQPNAWGFHDMLGNVWEWVEDRYKDDGYYARSPEVDPKGPEQGPALRIHRGGGWHDDPEHIRSAIRFYFGQSGRNNSLGFRLARNCP